MQIVSNVALISINATLVVQMLSFLVFLWLINRIMFRPLRQIMEERQFHIEKIKNDIIEADKTYDSILSEIKSQEAAVRKAALEISKEHEDAGNQEAVKILEEARMEIDALRHETETDIQSNLAKAKEQAETESEKLGTLLMEQLLNRRLI